MGLYKIIEKKKKEQRKKVAKVTGMSIVSGVAAGALAGVLFAPKSGKETRKDIKEKSIEVANQIKTKSIDIKDNISVGLEEKKEDIKEAKKKIDQYLASKKETEEKVETKEEVVQENEIEEI